MKDEKQFRVTLKLKKFHYLENKKKDRFRFNCHFIKLS